MPYELDKLRAQREEDGTYSIQIPPSWVSKGYLSPKSAMEAAEVELRKQVAPEIAKLREERKELVDEVDELRKRLTILESAISSMDSDIAELEKENDIAPLLAAGYDVIKLFEMDNFFTERYGKVVNVSVTPYDMNRDGVVAAGEFGFSFGWCRYKMEEVSTTND